MNVFPPDYRYRSLPFFIVQNIHCQKGHVLSEDEFLFGKDILINCKLMVFFILPRSRAIFSKFDVNLSKIIGIGGFGLLTRV